jgi:hypothetical protein
VDQDPSFLTRLEPDPDQLVHHAASVLRIWGDLLKFFVQEIVPARPVDVGVRVGKE